MKTTHVIFLTMADMDHYRAYRILPRINVFSKDMTFDIARYVAEAGHPSATLKFKDRAPCTNLDFYMTSMAAKAALYTPLPYSKRAKFSRVLLLKVLSRAITTRKSF
jgi:hypothetical protein